MFLFNFFRYAPVVSYDSIAHQIKILTSSMMILGLVRSSQAMLTRFRSPPDNPVMKVPPISRIIRAKHFKIFSETMKFVVVHNVVML